jgi:hypothetical protein
VDAQHRHEHKQEAEGDSPRSDPVRAWADALDRTAAWAWAPDLFARRRQAIVHQHQLLAGPHFAHSAAHRRDPYGALHPAPARTAALTLAATLDPLTHILDLGPPRTGLDSSWHGGDANSAGGG